MQHPFADEKNLRFFCLSGALARVLLPYILDRGPLYGRYPSAGLREPEDPSSDRKKIVVEFSSPNLGKEFDGAHLRSTIIGSYIAALYESRGWDVVRINYLGDWGKHIGLLALGWSKFGSDELFEADPLGHLLDVSTQIEELLKSEQKQIKSLLEDGQEAEAKLLEINGISSEKDLHFKKLEERDPEALLLWQRFRDLSVAKYAEQYSRLNISFDEFSGESTVKPETVAEIESALKEKDLYEESDDAWVINFSKLEIKGLKTAIGRYRNNTTTYLLRDVAAALERYRKYNFDKMIYVATSRQDSHFQQVFKTLESIGYGDLVSRLHHSSFKIGKDMGISPSDGRNGLLLGDILDQCRDAVDALFAVDPDDTEEFPKGNPIVSDALGVTNLLVQDLSHRHTTAVTFDLNQMTTVHGHTGLSLQQWYIALTQRLRGVEIDRESLERADMTIFEAPDSEHADVLRLLIQFPDQVKMSFKAHESSIILTYLFRVTEAISSVWGDHDPDEGGSSSRNDDALMALFQCALHVLENGMAISGLLPLKVYT